MDEEDTDDPTPLLEATEAPGAPQGDLPRVLPAVLPILPLKNTVVFPHLPTPLVVGRASSSKLIDDVMLKDRMLGLVLQKDPGVEDPKEKDLHAIGTAAVIQRMLKFPDGTMRVLITGFERIRLSRVVRTEPYLVAELDRLPDQTEQSVEMEALVANLRSQITKMLSLMPIASEEIGVALLNVQAPGRLADMAAALLIRDAKDKQDYLETASVRERLVKLTRQISREIEVLELGTKIQKEVQDEMEKGQREFVLRQQLKAIQRELGATDEIEAAIAKLKEDIEAAGMPVQAREAAERELNRLRTMPPASAEYVVTRTYLDWLISLPWAKHTADKIELQEARRILDEDHYDLKPVKDRILEFLAVRKLKTESRGPILCFVGPPGTGKTSLGRSIARSMGRAFHRLSLGGIRDEAEVRGHRRTYVGALPGQIIQGIRRSGQNNPVFMLDEVDKLGSDFRGDPSSALLEVLDPEQNSSFVDHYLDVPFDLSRVMFITTANILDTIPAPLRDRMEVLELPGYTDEEKLEIARRYLIPRQARENGLSPEDLKLDDGALPAIISGYTREAGLRNLEREIAKIGRKIALGKAEGRTDPVAVRAEDLVSYLGPRRFDQEVAERLNVPGVAIGMVWTPFGGHVLFIEATRMPGGHRLILTGQLGDVMRESAEAALSYIRSRASDLGINAGFFEKTDIHVHVPAGAVPKDGPSAGVTIATAIASLLTGRLCKPSTAMTGEITLRGKVLPIGGVKQKVLGARRAGITTIILPAENRKDLTDIPNSVLASLEFCYVKTVDEVLEAALQPRKESGKAAATPGRPSSRPRSVRRPRQSLNP